MSAVQSWNPLSTNQMERADLCLAICAVLPSAPTLRRKAMPASGNTRHASFGSSKRSSYATIALATALRALERWLATAEPASTRVS
jgi:hypothetical protein